MLVLSQRHVQVESTKDSPCVVDIYALGVVTSTSDRGAQAHSWACMGLDYHITERADILYSST